MLTSGRPLAIALNEPRRVVPGTCSRFRPFTPAGPHRRPAQPLCRTTGGATYSVALDTSAPTVSTATGDAVAAHASVASPEEARALVDQVLAAIEGTDSGISLSGEQRARVNSLLGRLEAIGAAQQPRPLANPLLWGNYNVAYTSVGREAEQRGEPAGGRFRGRIGRALFRTAGLFQSVLQPDIATNKVEFRLFGCLPGHVGLRGKVMPVGEGGDTVQVLFEPPVLSVADKLHLRIGGFSTVTLSTTYLDERVRLGKGSRGSLFVFTRGGAADAAGMDQVCLQRTTFAAAALFSAFFVSLFLAGAALWATAHPALKAAAVLTWLLGAAVGGVVRQGGLVMDRDERRLADEARAAMERWEKRKQDEQKKEQEAEGGSGSGGVGGVAAAPTPAVA